MTEMIREPIPVVVPSAPPDLRVVAQRVADVQSRLDDVYEGARRAFHAIPDTLDATLANLQGEGDSKEWATRNYVARWGLLQEQYQNVADALTAADAAHDLALLTLAARDAEIKKLHTMTSVRDADAATTLKERSHVLTVADMELRALVQKVARMMPVFEAALARQVQASLIIVHRMQFARAVQALGRAKAIVEAVQANRTKDAGDAAPLLAMLDHLRRKRNEPLPIPHLVWPTGADPFEPPMLTEA